MIHTFTGAPLPLGQAIRRPRQPRRVQRATRVATPSSFFVLWVELLGIDKDRAWDVYQAMVSTSWSEVRAFIQPLQVWQTIPDTLAEFARRGVTPQRLCYAVELYVLDGRVSPSEAAVVENAICTHVDRDGHWKEPRCR